MADEGHLGHRHAAPAHFLGGRDDLGGAGDDLLAVLVGADAVEHDAVAVGGVSRTTTLAVSVSPGLTVAEVQVLASDRPCRPPAASCRARVENSDPPSMPWAMTPWNLVASAYCVVEMGGVHVPDTLANSSMSSWVNVRTIWAASPTAKFVERAVLDDVRGQQVGPGARQAFEVRGAGAVV